MSIWVNELVCPFMIKYLLTQNAELRTWHLLLNPMTQYLKPNTYINLWVQDILIYKANYFLMVAIPQFIWNVIMTCPIDQ